MTIARNWEVHQKDIYGNNVFNSVNHIALNIFESGCVEYSFTFVIIKDTYNLLHSDSLVNFFVGRCPHYANMPMQYAAIFTA